MVPKSEFARRQGVSPTQINRDIESGKFAVVKMLNGFEVIYLEHKRG